MEYKVLVVSSVQPDKVHESKINELAHEGMVLKQAVCIRDRDIMYIFEKPSNKQTLHS